MIIGRMALRVSNFTQHPTMAISGSASVCTRTKLLMRLVLTRKRQRLIRICRILTLVGAVAKFTWMKTTEKFRRSVLVSSSSKTKRMRRFKQKKN
jgi:hypothetical protein